MNKVKLQKYWKDLSARDYMNRFVGAKLALRKLGLKVPPSWPLIKPRRLNYGDTIGIVAPGWTFDAEKFKKGVDKLKQLGFKVKYSRSIFSKYWSMAGYDRERARQINQMFADKKVKAIFCAKAGYGSARTIPYLDRQVIRKNPKIFVGYSDITILLSYLYRTTQMVVFHGPVVSDEIHDEMNPLTLDYLLKILMRPAPLGELRFANLKSVNFGRGSGTLVGGNMSLIMSTMGTAYEVDTDRKILFLEDIGEDLEVIDNYLMQLKLAGKFKQIEGLIFGRMVDCIDHSEERFTLKDVLKDILYDVDVPIIYNFPSGHRAQGELNISLPLGTNITIDANKPSVTFNEQAVS